MQIQTLIRVKSLLYLLQSHKDFDDARVNAFVCDPTVDDLIQHISPSSVDVVTMVLNQSFFL